MSLLQSTAEMFLQAWRTRHLEARGKVDIHALTPDQAYEVQRLVIAARLSSGESVMGYKVGCTSVAIRRQFGLAEPICGRVMAPYVFYGDTSLNWSDYVCCAVEPEFVLTLGKDLRREVEDDEQLVDAIKWVAPGIEVHNYKFWFGQPTLQELIASNGIHACLVVGADKIEPTGLDFESEGISLFKNGKWAASGIGADIMGGPLRSLRWLANHLLKRGEHLQAGQIVIPGSAVELVHVAPGDRVVARFTHFGSVETEFHA